MTTSSDKEPFFINHRKFSPVNILQTLQHVHDQSAWFALQAD